MACGCVPTDRFEWRKVKPYLLYVVMFVSTIYTNMRALGVSNVETIIVFRAACPLVVCILDWAFLGRQLPSMRSALSLVVILFGCVGYVLTDRAFKLNGWAAYQWVSAYFVIISLEMAYGKHIVGPQLGFASMWGPTLYTNFISIPPMLSIGLATHEEAKLHAAQLTATSITLLVLSCAIGVAISYLGWRARSSSPRATPCWAWRTRFSPSSRTRCCGTSTRRSPASSSLSCASSAPPATSRPRWPRSRRIRAPPAPATPPRAARSSLGRRPS